ncbi:MAG: 50S ribosomal protein L6 [Candidatus Woesearchaeota archaeon]
MAKENANGEKGIFEEIEIPAGVSARLDGSLLSVQGPKGEVVREFKFPNITLEISEGKIVVSAAKPKKRAKTQLYSVVAHIKNMIRGVQEGYVYLLKICYSHFPIKATVSGDEFSVKNFLGERKPRTMKIPSGVKVTVDGNIVRVEGTDKEKTGQTAASIEQLCTIKNRDRRIFQDGIFIYEKAGKNLLE